MSWLCACRGASATDGKHGLVQWGLDYAKGFIEDKLKRPSASDLLVEDDVKLLPKVSLLTCPDPVPSNAILHTLSGSACRLRWQISLCPLFKLVQDVLPKQEELL